MRISSSLMMTLVVELHRVFLSPLRELKLACFLPHGAEVTAEFMGDYLWCMTTGYIKLKINGCAFICIWPDPISPVLHRNSLAPDKKQ